MRRSRRILVSLGIAAGVWTLLSWPLPRYLATAVPVSAQDVEGTRIRAMIPGDHLQILYHFWLFDDMLRGKTPLFYNLYEFNAGDDAERREPGSYYFPFSLVYALISRVAGPAAGWNLTALASLWLTGWVSWILARRYTGDEWLAAAAAVVALAFPYRWASLLGGSPTGMAMLWPPVVMLGIDLAVRQGRAAGGALAGAALLFAAWTDVHTFFFCTLALPLFCLAAWLQALARPHRGAWRARGAVLALLPVPLFLAAAVLGSYLTPSSGASHARRLSEVALFSPLWRGFFSLKATGPSAYVYIGFTLPLAAAAGGLFVLPGSPRSRPADGTERPPLALACAYGLLLLAAGGILALALGPNAPDGGLLLRCLRRCIPPYGMIRQPAKIFCLLPVILGLAAVMSLDLLRRRRGAATARAAAVAMATAILAESSLRTEASLTRLDQDQGAYAAVAADAAVRATPARALALPLWPGDSHYTSVYGYYASLHRIRLVNGYRPFVPPGYVEQVFRPMESLNAGIVGDGQLDELQRRGIDYVLLHENLFPEKVSPFPVTFTLDRLRGHPRLSLLRHAEEVWAFRILERPRDAAAEGPGCVVPFPARRWELEAFGADGARPLRDPEAAFGAFLRLSPPASAALPAVAAPASPGLRWLVRARGSGELRLRLRGLGGADPGEAALSIATPEWTWFEAAVPPGRSEAAPVSLQIQCLTGEVDADAVLLAAGAWPAMRPGDRIDLAARCFFHAGYSDPETGRVFLRRDRDPAAAVFYGPKLPFPVGSYEARVVTAAAAPAGTQLGRLSIRWRDDEEAASAPVVAGQDSTLAWTQTRNLPVNLVFVYNRQSDMSIERVVLTRRNDP